MKKTLLPIVLILALLAGCASNAPRNALEKSNTEQQEQMRSVHADLIKEMMRQERYHAALAHIEEIQRSDFRKDELLLLHARVLFKMGEIQQAHAEFTQLLGGPLDADAMHGIGLIYAINDRKLSLRYLSKASQGKPTDAGMRNDYGYALLREAKYEQARLQLETAHELAPQDMRFRNNALLALLILDEEQAAQALARKTAMPPADVEHIRSQAQNWKYRAAQQQTSDNPGTDSQQAATSVAAVKSP